MNQETKLRIVGSSIIFGIAVGFFEHSFGLGAIAFYVSMSACILMATN